MEDINPEENPTVLLMGCRMIYFALCERTGIEPDPDTPERMANALLELCQKSGEVEIKNFPLGDYHKFADGVVTLDNIPFTSLCNHHMLPFFGTVRIGYALNRGSDYVLGISKLARIVSEVSSKPGIQEEMADEISLKLQTAIENTGVPSPGVCVEITAQHICVTGRGAKSVPSRMTYLSTRGKQADINRILKSWSLRK